MNLDENHPALMFGANPSLI